jgi:hypothetical protein
MIVVERRVLARHTFPPGTDCQIAQALAQGFASKTNSLESDHKIVNFTVENVPDSDSALKSLQIRWNSAAGIVIDIHELDIILANPVVARVLKDEVDDVWRILCLQSQDVFALRSAEHFCKGPEIDTEGDVTVASEGREGFGSQ